MLELIQKYNFTNVELAPTELLRYCYSDGRSHRHLFFVLILNDQHRVHLQAEFRHSTEGWVKRDLWVDPEKEMLQHFRQLQSVMTDLEPEYDSGELDDASCMVVVRNPSGSAVRKTRVNFPFSPEETPQFVFSPAMAILKKALDYLEAQYQPLL